MVASKWPLSDYYSLKLTKFTMITKNNIRSGINTIKSASCIYQEDIVELFAVHRKEPKRMLKKDLKRL